MTQRATLKKSEILRLKNDIDELFKEGKSVKALPLKILYQALPPDTTKPKVQAMFIVSKRTLKSAARRNRIKRCMREAYRHLKADLLTALSQRCPFVHHLRLALLFQSASTETVSTKQMKMALNKGIEKVVERLSHEQIS
jgi:ribonuclease P protein component